MKKPPILATPWGLYGILMAILACALVGLAIQGRSTPAAAGTLPKASPEPPTFIYGSTNARFTLVEYGDLECPYCKDVYPQVKQLINGHEALNWQWHHLPLPMHGEAAQQEARLVTCAGWFGGNPVFWQAVEAVYQHSRGNGAGLAVPIDQLGLQPAVSLQHLQACIQDNTTVRRVVAEQTATAAQKRIEATPTLAAGRQEPNVAANQVAQTQVDQNAANLQAEIQNLKTELDMRRELAGNSPTTILQRASIRKDASKGIFQGDPLPNRLDRTENPAKKGE